MQLVCATRGLMARILYLTSGLTSMVYAATELGARLRSRGHEVVYASPEDCQTPVAAAGFEFRLLDRDRDYKHRFAMAHSTEDRKQARQQSLENREVEELVAAVDPDLLLIDMELHFPLIVTRTLGIPTLIPIVWYSIFFSTGNPPLHTDLTPDRSFRVMMAWLQLWTNKIRRLLAERARRYLSRSVPEPVTYKTRSRSDLAELARTRGFSLRRHTTVFQWLRPFTWTDIDVMSYNPAEMEFSKISHSRLHHVGPMVNTGSAEPGLAEDWTDFATRRDSTRPLIYCSLGSFWDIDRVFLDNVIEVFRRRPDWDLVLGLGSKAEPDSFDDIPDNVLLLSWAPQFDVLKHSAAAITHGGISTINECIWNGVPMVGYSTGRVDQDGCVARMVHQGLGIAGDRSSDGPEQIEAAVGEVLGNARYRELCLEMADVFAEYRDSAVAEQLVESRLR